MKSIESYIFYNYFNNNYEIKFKSKIDNLCNQKFGKTYVLDNFLEKGVKVTFLNDIDEFLYYKEIDVTDIFKDNLFNIKKIIYSDEYSFDDGKVYIGYGVFDSPIPKLQKCLNLKDKNCCSSKEYNTYIFKKYLEKKVGYDKQLLYKFIDLDEYKQDKILSSIITSEEKNYNIVLNEIEKIEKQNLKTEIKKEVIIPIDKPLKIEQMGLLESTIFGTFVVVKNLLK